MGLEGSAQRPREVGNGMALVFCQGAEVWEKIV